jgi:hypothetical protein
MKPNSPIEEPKNSDFVIRVHLTDGSVDSFAADEIQSRNIWEKLEPGRLFASPRFVLAGQNSKSVYVSSHVLRLDFIQTTYKCWEFPGGYADIVELSEKEFIKHAHLGEPERMAKREQQTPVGDLLVSFVKLHMMGGKSIFVMTEFPIKLPADNQFFMHFLLSKGGFHMRMAEGGIGVVNLALLAGYNVYPGVAQVPADTWIAEPLLKKTSRQK